MFYKIFIVLLCFSCSSKHIENNKNVVVSDSKHASQIGLNILEQGGNAFDAAVAVAFALAVTRPEAGNLGGGGFAVIMKSGDEPTTIDFRETAPMLSYEKMFLNDDGLVIKGESLYSAKSSGVPGTVAGLGYIYEKYGSMQWDSLLQPAIDLASKGFIPEKFLEELFANQKIKDLLSEHEETKSIFYSGDSYSKDGFLLQQDLARTINRIQSDGWREFYYGLTAKMIISTMKSKNGIKIMLGITK